MESKAKRKFDDGVDPTPIAKHKKVIGPSLPPPAATDPSISDSGGDSDDNFGPTRPPPNPSSDGDSGSDSDDDFGPGLPPSGPLAGSNEAGPDASSMNRASSVTETEAENQRDQWMLHPPTQSDWASKIDPTQLRNRRFNTGKSATASKKMDSSWVESPEERMKRLQDAVMGVGASTAQSGEHTNNTELKKAQIRQYNVSLAISPRLLISLGSLFNHMFLSQDTNRENIHRKKRQASEEEDDPSARAFDREKDMAIAGKVSNAQRREMVKKAADYDTRFTKGSFL